MTEKQLKKKILDSGRTLLFSNEDLKRLIIPLVIDQVLVRTVGMADTMMISSVGEAAISGVSLVDMINMLINAVFAAVATGGAVIASQYLGHRDREKACEASSQLMVVTAVCALLFTVLSLVARKPLLSLLFGQIDADVMDAALTYLTVSAISFPFLASFNSSSALFRAMNDSRNADDGFPRYERDEPCRQLHSHLRHEVGRCRRGDFHAAFPRDGGGGDVHPELEQAPSAVCASRSDDVLPADACRSDSLYRHSQRH